MTIAVHNHIHLNGTSTDPPTTTYNVQHGTLDHTEEVAVAVERSITGLLHTHRIESASGVPLQFDADKYTIILRGSSAVTDLVTLKALAGQRVYVTTHYHDDDENGGDSLNPWATSAYVKRAILQLQGITNVSPDYLFWTVQVSFIDDDVVTS